MPTQPHATEVLDFWFGELDQHGNSPDSKVARWWTSDPAFDQTIEERFGELHSQAAAGELDNWKSDDISTLALIIVLDQFSRNLFRNTPQMVAQDQTALELAHELIERGKDRTFPSAWRSFVYLPMMHSEDLKDQDRCVELFEILRDEKRGSHRAAAESQVDFAVRHREIIQQFSRFPHRNAFLGRASTDREVEFLEQPGSSF